MCGPPLVWNPAGLCQGTGGHGCLDAGPAQCAVFEHIRMAQVACAAAAGHAFRPGALLKAVGMGGGLKC